MLAPRARWALPSSDRPPLDPGFSAVAAAGGISSRLAALLAARGVDTAAELQRFLGPARDALNDPAGLPDADRFLAAVLRARDTAARVLVFGDFDADGVTGLAIMVSALRSIGVEAIPYVPSRLDEGHGLSLAAVEAATAAGAAVIVTVDTGSSSVTEVAAAMGRGLAVLITDHHRVPAAAPVATALVNPHRDDSTYPDRRLSGAGISFALARLLTRAVHGTDDAAIELADLAAIGTVADVAPVLGENRAIVRLGLDRIRRGPRPGLAALLARAGTMAARVDAETIGFVIAPRLNAAGRVGEALDAALLLLATDAVEAERLAAILESANATRRDLLATALASARTSPDASGDAPAIIVRGDWPVGIIGLVAGRLAEEHHRPAIVGTELGGVVRASCRGDGAVHLADTLAACADLLIRHGGHRGAAGFEVASERWDELRDRLLLLAVEAGPLATRARLDVDVSVPAVELTYALHRELIALAPYGPGHPEPLVAVHGLTVQRTREANGGHTQLVLRRVLDVVDGIAFGWPELARLAREGDRIDVVGRVMTRAFGGVESLQLEIRDAAPSGHDHAAEPAEALSAAPAAALAASGA